MLSSDLGGEPNPWLGTSGRVQADLGAIPWSLTASALMSADPLDTDEPGVGDPGGPSMEELSRELDNPLGKLWMLFLQNDFMTYRGDPVRGTQNVNVTTFMPVLSIPIGDQFNLVNRPIIPFISAPKPNLPDVFGRFPGDFLTPPPPSQFARSVSTDREFELADIAFFSALGPAEPWKGKLIYGGGVTWQFPTASDDFFSADRAGVGPVGLAVWNGPEWKFGVIAQHWWSFTGSSSRPPFATSNIQYLLYKQLPDQWQIGMGPNVLINWKAASGEKVTFPVGLGFNKTTLVGGKLPMRIGAELQYAVIHPDDYSQRLIFRVYVVPVIPSPFGGLGKGG